VPQVFGEAVTGRPRSFDWEKAIEMIDDGYTIEGICSALGCTRAALWNARRTLGHVFAYPRGPRGIDEERVDWLTREGRSAPYIAEILGCSKRTVVRARARLRRISQ
jgi:biotin operon repressor